MWPPRVGALTWWFVMGRLRFLVLAALVGQPAVAADIHFCWQGANGYTMTGQMSFPDNKAYTAIVTEDDLTQFQIVGYHKGEKLGSWTMQQATESTTWHLRYDPVGMQFLTGDRFATTNSQGWNANGGVTDCGQPGFGFNSGNYAQDICLNGVYVVDSSIPPDTPLAVSSAPFSHDCSVAAPLSKSALVRLGD